MSKTADWLGYTEIINIKMKEFISKYGKNKQKIL